MTLPIFLLEHTNDQEFQKTLKNITVIEYFIFTLNAKTDSVFFAIGIVKQF